MRSKFVSVMVGGALHPWAGPNPDTRPESRKTAVDLAKHLAKTTGKKAYAVLIEEILPSDCGMGPECPVCHENNAEDLASIGSDTHYHCLSCGHNFAVEG